LNGSVFSVIQQLQLEFAVEILLKKLDPNNPSKPGTPVLRSIHLLNPLRERIRRIHYNLRAEKARAPQPVR
jgi:hypothetical protein